MFCTVLDRTLKDYFRHIDIHSQHMVAVVEASIRDGTLMKYRINTANGIPIDVLHIAVEDRSSKVGKLLFAGHAGEHDIVSLRRESEGDIRADEPGPSCDERTHNVPIIYL